MRLRRFAWLALLLPQFALLLLFAYADLRELRHEFQLHQPRMMTQCLSYPRFDAVEFAFTLLGLAGIIGLCGKHPWARCCYMVFAIGLLAALLPDLLHPPRGDISILLVPVVVLATSALCFVPRFRLS